MSNTKITLRFTKAMVFDAMEGLTAMTIGVSPSFSHPLICALLVPVLAHNAPTHPPNGTTMAIPPWWA